MAYRVVITPLAKKHLESYISYTLTKYNNKQAARAIRDDAQKTKARLADAAEKLAFCDDKILAKNGYRKIMFEKHDFFMVYRVCGKEVIVEAMYHELQDFGSLFAQEKD